MTVTREKVGKIMKCVCVCANVFKLIVCVCAYVYLCTCVIDFKENEASDIPELIVHHCKCARANENPRKRKSLASRSSEFLH